jgi:hypothetical protein
MQHCLLLLLLLCQLLWLGYLQQLLLHLLRQQGWQGSGSRSLQGQHPSPGLQAAAKAAAGDS